MTHTKTNRGKASEESPHPDALLFERAHADLKEMRAILAELDVILHMAKAEGKTTIPNPFCRKRT